MGYTVHLKLERPFAGRVTPARLRAAARAALKHQAAPQPGELTIVLTSDQALRTLNRDFLGHDHVTDVLSFPSDDINPEANTRYFGDIVIAYPRARAQALRGGHPIWAELQLLIVHGVLHLLGYDHAEPAERDRMWTAQAAILAKLKAPITGPK